MKSNLKTVVIVLCGLFVFAFAGCSDPNNNSSSQETPQEQIPEGFVKVAGTTVTGSDNFSSTNEGTTYYGAFIAGRTVEISTFYMSDHEVTQAEYQAVVGSNPSEFHSNPVTGEVQTKRPVEQVSWYDALIYCNKKSFEDGFTPCYTINGKTNPTEWGTVPTSDMTDNSTWDAVICNWEANGYRLPTEAEWEYAARGGSTLSTNTYSGTNGESGALQNYAWYIENSLYGSECVSHEIKKKNANSLEIYDMSGNVYEWCWDWSGDITSSTPATGATSGGMRIIRGGSLFQEAYRCAVSYSEDNTPFARVNDCGFRVVRSCL